DDLGHGAVGQTQHQRDRHGIAVSAHREDAPWCGAAAPRAPTLLIVAGLLLGREDLADARPGGLADLLGAGLALLIGQAGEGPHLAPAILEDRVELLLLSLGELEILNEALADLLDASRPSGRGAASRGGLWIARRRRPGGRTGIARRAKAQGRIGDLQDA